MDKNKKILLDMLIVEEFCNSKCRYCEGFYGDGLGLEKKDGGLCMPQSWKKMIKELGLENSIPEKPNIEDFFKLAEVVIDKLLEFYDISILKISGGEVFINPNLLDFVKNNSHKFQAIQILTNATLLNKQKIDELTKIKNAYVQISLDGVTVETNNSRNDNQALLNHILSNIDYLLEKGIPLEINTVLTKYNTGNFEEMLYYFKKNEGKIIIMPRPVRGEPRQIMDPTKEQIDNFEELFKEKYDEYKKLLPPKIYLDRVVEMMRNDKRDWSCFVPEFILGSNNYGQIPNCIRTEELSYAGNILNPDYKFNPNGYIYNPLNQKESVCDYCIVQYELFNLLKEGTVKYEEVSHIPTFAVKGVEEKVAEIING